MTKIIFLFYNYYNEGSTKNVAYLKALIATLVMFTLFVAGLAILITDNHKTLKSLEESKSLTYFYSFGFVCTGLLILRGCYPKNVISSYVYGPNRKRDGWLLLISLIFSFCLFSFACFNK